MSIDLALMGDAEIEADVEEMYAAAQRPKREGGLGPIKRRQATPERLRRSITAARATAIAVKGTDQSRETTIQEAVKAAEAAEPVQGIIAMILLAVISAVIRWAVERWLDKRFPPE